MEQIIMNLFLDLLNLSISATWLILAVVLLRLIFKKAPKWVNCLLWAISGIRLVFPFSVESIFSLVPSAETVPPEIIYDAEPKINSGISAFNSLVNPVITEAFAPVPASSVNPLQAIAIIASYLWVIGIVIMVLYALVSFLRLKYKMSTATLLRDNIFQSENVQSPFVLGFFRPKIYLSYDIGDSDICHVIAHEKAHIKRKDYLIKPFAYLILCVYWFNPAVWLAYILLCRDIELACDEKVIREMDSESRKDYSEALLNCSVNRRSIAACPLAFGEVGVKERIKGVMNYKKPAFWVIVVAAVSSVITAVCFLTYPVTDKSEITNPGESDYSAVIDQITADIDGDGKKENCTLTYGPTSGLYTVVFTATEVGSEEPEYINTFNIPFTDGTEFHEAADGKVQIKCGNSVYMNGESVKTEDVYLNIKIEDGNIALYDGDEPIEYWGEQGITPSEFFAKITALENAVSEAVLNENKGAYVIKEGKDEFSLAKSFEAHNILYMVKDDEKKKLTVYVLTLYKEYILENGMISSLASGAEPVEITFKATEEEGKYEYLIKKYRHLGKGDGIENYLPEDYEYNTQEIMEGLELDIERQKNAHFGYLDNSFSGLPIISDDSQQLTFMEVSHDYLQNMIYDVINQRAFNDFEYERTALRRVFYRDRFYYYCGYKNENDRVFVFFQGFDLQPVCVIDFNKTIKGSDKCALVGEEYSVCENLIRQIDKIS
ncbi:MAG: transcriptional regulator [Clostridia bacterium]|nr:transcriptional regulator [Clostridia bacterium]